MNDYIEIKGARIHNLKNIDICIPRNKLTVITGVSGSGKSSLAFDTLYEEGKRRYLLFSGAQFMVDTVSGFDSMTGLSPTVAVEQRIIRQSNPRSTVGTRTKIGNMLAVLFATYGKLDPEYDNGVPLSMEMFQKNSPKGMCIKCLGKGKIKFIDEEAIYGDTSIAVNQILEGRFMRIRSHRKRLYDFCKTFNIQPEQPLSSLSQEQFIALKYGSPRTRFQGVNKFVPVAENELQKKLTPRQELFVLKKEYASMKTCPRCGGTGLCEQAAHTTIYGKTIFELEKMYIKDLVNLLQNRYDRQAGTNLINEMLTKLQCMVDVGLHHLSLSRPVPTLSGGEIQRLFLASFIIAEMDSIIFIFDEPTIGLHEVEKAKLIEIIRSLVKRGNTVIAVEHDENFMRAADYIIDLGPDAGIYGGERIFQGSYNEFVSCKASRTSPYLLGLKTLGMKKDYRPVDRNRLLIIENASLHNLQNVTVSIPLGCMVGIAGVSGSGKSSLINDTLVPKLKEILKSKMIHDNEEDETADYNVTVKGYENIGKCVVVDQRPIGRSRTSCPATYTGMLDRIRALFAQTPEAIENGYTAGLFTVNSEGGCRVCNGEGVIHYHVGFGNFIDLDCEMCGGTGFIEEAMSISLDGKNIKEILGMSVNEAAVFFGCKMSPAYDKVIYNNLKTLERVGMGYITLGQKTPTISGGEAQRIKLAKELAKQNGKDNVYILDEPTTGLAFADTERLIALTQQLIDAGNTVIVTEHDPSVLSNCDYIIEMGPGGGSDGGFVIAAGTPQELKANKDSIIGKYLRQV